MTTGVKVHLHDGQRGGGGVQDAGILSPLRVPDVTVTATEANGVRVITSSMNQPRYPEITYKINHPFVSRYFDILKSSGGPLIKSEKNLLSRLFAY